jgi:glycosyltransferase involved in cell wall biosynthesis
LPVHQVLVSASLGDAITNFAFELRDLLRQLGPSEIFARHVDPALALQVRPLAAYRDEAGPRPGGTVLVYHASIGNTEVTQFLTERPERLVLAYHNISPPESFAPYQPEFAQLLEAGRLDLVRLRDRVALALAVSEYNAADLTALGYTDVQVTPLILDPKALHKFAPDEGTRRHLDTHVHGPLALFVGQLLPHKRPELLVEALHAVATYLIPEAHLVLLGSRRIPVFASAVQRQIVELGLANAWIVGSVTPEQLRSYYERADLLVTASDHEGFCVPLLEAMSFDVPIVARATSAIPETLAGAGVMVDPSDGALVFAEAWAQVATDVDLRDALVGRGRERIADFDAARTRRTVLDQLAALT